MLNVMSAAAKPQPTTVDEYLAGEIAAEVKHEYLGGYIYAMAGGTNAHNRIASNVLGALHAALRGQSCAPFNSDTKIRLKLPAQVRFYYPDVSVICDPNSPDDTFQDQPVVIVEVLSRGTRRVDHGEKKDAYLSIPSLSVYLLVEQECPVVTAYRRTEQGFIEEIFADLSATIPLPEVGGHLRLSEIYERVEFVREPDEEK